MKHSFMALQTRRFFRIPNYVRAFGFRNGVRLLIQIERPVNTFSSIVRRHRVPGFPAPIHLRETTGDHSTFWQCLVTRQYDLRRFAQTEKLEKQYQTMLSHGQRPVVLDAGGNIGLAAIWFAQAFPRTVIVSVEPEQGNFEMLTRNVAHLRAQVMPILGAVAEGRKQMRIVNPDAGSSAFRVEEARDTKSGQVTGYTVDELVSMVDGGALFIAKLDIEGGQRYLFQANTEWVGKVHLIILELDDWQFPWEATSRNFFSALSKYRFDYLISGENLFCFQHI